MQATQRSETKLGLSGICPTVNADEQQRPLGKTYRLILSYEPQKQAIAQSAFGETAPPILGLCWNQKYRRSPPLAPDQLAEMLGRPWTTLYRHRSSISLCEPGMGTDWIEPGRASNWMVRAISADVG